MSSERLWKIPLFSFPIFVAHGLEEYLTYSYSSIPSFISIGQTFGTSAQSGFLVFQVVWWSLLVISIFLIKKRIWILSQLSILGIAAAYVFELEHVVNSIIIRNYYSGLITSIPLLVIGFLFWKELMKAFMRNSRNT